MPLAGVISYDQTSLTINRLSTKAPMPPVVGAALGTPRSRFMGRVSLHDRAAPLYFPLSTSRRGENGPSIMQIATDAADYHRQGYLPGRRLLSADEAMSMRGACVRTCGVEIKDTSRRQANNRLKPYLLFRWAADLVRHREIGRTSCRERV